MEFFRNENAAVTFVLLFIPGFVSTRVFDLLVPGQPRDYGKTIYEVVGYSFITYAFWSPAIVAYHEGWHPPLWVAMMLAGLILVVTPIVLPVLFLKIVRKWFASSVLDPFPSSWDWAFKVNETAMVLVHLRDGRKLGGTWERTAFSSSYPIPPDLFLSEVWNVDQETGTFNHRVQDSKGIFLWGSDIEMVEFFDIQQIREKADGRRQAETTQPR